MLELGTVASTGTSSRGCEPPANCLVFPNRANRGIKREESPVQPSERDRPSYPSSLPTIPVKVYLALVRIFAAEPGHHRAAAAQTFVAAGVAHDLPVAPCTGECCIGE